MAAIICSDAAVTGHLRNMLADGADDHRTPRLETVIGLSSAVNIFRQECGGSTKDKPVAADPLSQVRNEIGLRLAEILASGPRLSPLDLHARMDAICQLAASNGLDAMEGLARCSAQMALLPGYRVTVRSCLDHAGDALGSRSPGDCTAILAALAVRLH